MGHLKKSEYKIIPVEIFRLIREHNTIEQICERYKIPYSTLRRFIRNHFPRVEFDKIINENRQRAGLSNWAKRPNKGPQKP